MQDGLLVIKCLIVRTASKAASNEHNKQVFLKTFTTFWASEFWRGTVKGSDLEVFWNPCVMNESPVAAIPWPGAETPEQEA